MSERKIGPRYGVYKVQRTAHSGLDLHIPARAKRELKMKKGDEYCCYVNLETGVLTYEPLKKWEAEE